MDNIKDDKYYITRVLNDIRFLIKHTKDVNYAQFKENEVLLDSVLFRLIQISENTKRMSSQLKENNPQIPWTSITGFRNRVVHEYVNIDLSIVYSIISRDLSDLLNMFSFISI